MKRLIAPFLLFAVITCFGQALPDFDAIRLVSPEDFKAAEPSVEEAANYQLTVAFDKNDISRLKALQFIIKWMQGTPDYMFTLDVVADKIIKGNDDMLGLYMACMSKYCLENKDAGKDAMKVRLGSVKLLLQYCENDSNKVKMNKSLRKLSEANKHGDLENELKKMGE